MRKIVLVIGTRPNFVKIARLEKLLRKEFDLSIYHTGQHDSYNMSKWFIDFFKIQVDRKDELPKGSSTVERFGIVCKQFGDYVQSRLCSGDVPDAVMVVGDVDSTFACAFTAKKMGIPIIHLESGLRSFDKNMPEETNRVLTDHISDIKFVTDPIGVKNLLDEGCAKPGLDTFWVGNTMIDTLRWLNRYHLSDQPSFYDIVMTFHRPENVDDLYRARQMMDFFKRFHHGHRVCLCSHPRLERNIGFDKLTESGIDIMSQPNYIDFIQLIKGCKVVVTDSGGVQEEAAYFNKPTVTVRKSTERPVTTYINDNIVTPDFKMAAKHVSKFLKGDLHDGDSYYIKHNPYHKLGETYKTYGYDKNKLNWRNNASQEIVNILRKVL